MSRARVIAAGLAALFLAAAAPPEPRAKPGGELGGIGRAIAPKTDLADDHDGRGPKSAKSGALGGAPVDTSGDLAIESDTLEVALDQKLVTFSGNVDATQGGVRLRADRVKAYFADAKGAKKPAAPAPAGAAAFGDISRLEAEGNVRVATAGETARGGRAVYDVPGQRITLRDNVVLTGRESVIRSEGLEFNLATGVINLLSPAPTAGGSEGGRVKGLFKTPGTAPGGG
ncbi:MAG: LPS export ABC transporter periplasmic protein LptC [Alphaproteobacteria bacterium]|nr:LPS export ABC transporter periplasmic protein LptC [Alphaproteobacteria bacterium]